MKKKFIKAFVLLSLLSLLGCFNNDNKSEKDSTEIKIVKNGNFTEIYSTGEVTAGEFEIKGLLTESDINVNANFLSIIKHNSGNTVLSIASTLKSDSKIKLFSLNSSKFDFNTISIYNSKNTKAVTRVISPTAEALKCDFNLNKSIDLADFIKFTQYYGTTLKETVGLPDLNGDLTVNISDFIIFARNYGNFIDSIDGIEQVRTGSFFSYSANQNIAGIEFLLTPSIPTENIVVRDTTLKIVKENNGTILALTTSDKYFPKGINLFSIRNCSQPIILKINTVIPFSLGYEIISNLSVKTHSTSGNYILKSYSDWSEVCGNLLSKTEIFNLDFQNYDYIASFAGQRPNSGYAMALASFVETDSSISIIYSEMVPVSGAITLQVITCPHVLIKIPKTSKKIVFNSTSGYMPQKLDLEINKQNITSTEGNITLTPEGDNSLKYPLNDILSGKSIFTLLSGKKYTLQVDIQGYSSYSRVFTVQGGDIYIYIDKLDAVKDGTFINSNGSLTSVTPAETISGIKTFNYTASSSGNVSLENYANGSLTLSKSLNVELGGNYQFIQYSYSDSGKNKIEGFLTDNKIKLDIYSNGWGNLIERRYVVEGNLSASPYEVTPYSGSGSYFAYAYKAGYYTGLYRWNNGTSIDIKLTPVESDSNIHGKFFFDEGFFADSPIDNTTITVLKDNIALTTFKTDANGKYSVNLPAGEYLLNFHYTGAGSDGSLYSEKMVVTGKYHDYKILCHVLMAKPNIYLYPKTKTKLNVTLNFPNSGSVVKSIPDYGTGWNNITVEPSGTINGKYGYLFYESDNRDFSQYNEGWIIKKENLEIFFRKNMTDYGFRGQEIEDFIEYWIPLLKDSSSYAIYPQLDKDISKEVVLNISQKPDSLLRLIYTIKPCNSCLNLKEPVISSFSRNGFTVTEWGVIIK